MTLVPSKHVTVPCFSSAETSSRTTTPVRAVTYSFLRSVIRMHAFKGLKNP